VEDAKQLYLDMVKRGVTYLLYGQEILTPVVPDNLLERMVVGALRWKQVLPMKRIPVDEQTRMEGRDWPPMALTMIGMERLNNIQACVEDVLAKGVPGDLIEAGTWRGGAGIFMRAILKAHGITDRELWISDSFEGLPTPDPGKFPADEFYVDDVPAFLAVGLEQVRRGFARFGLLDEQVHFLKGWFKDTLPSLADKRWAVVRIDADMYESTMQALELLYPNLSEGGYVIVDDYGGLDSCRDAVEDYRKKNGISEALQKVDWTAIYWQKAR
jgi:O-methyltransferase